MKVAERIYNDDTLFVGLSLRERNALDRALRKTILEVSGKAPG